MSEVANVLLIGPEFAYEGQSYRVSPTTLEVEALLERELTGEALKAVQRHRGELAPDEYAGQMDGWRRDCASGVYAFGSPHFVQWAVTPRGMKARAYWSLAVANKNVQRDLIERVWKDDAAWEDLHLKVQEANSDPNRRAATS